MRLKLALAAGASLLAVAGTAAAQTPTPAPDPRDAIIQALTARLDAVEAQVADLKAGSAADVADIRQIQAAQPQVALAASGRPTITSSDGSTKFAIRGLVQFDGAEYDQDNKASPNDLASGTNFRRARLGIEGTFATNWNYNLTAEFGGSGVESPVLNQGWVEYAGFKPWASDQATPLRIRVGAWADPENLEDATPNTDGLFLERPASAELARGLAAGDGRSGLGVLANGARWYASADLTGGVVGQGSPAVFDEQLGYVLRAAFLPIQTPDFALHLGVNYTDVVKPADTGAGPLDTEQLQLTIQPELRVDTTKLLDTGKINADNLIQEGAELGGYYKSLFVSGEAFDFNLNPSKIGAPDDKFSGWYGQVSWALTGEQHKWLPASGGFAGIKPAKNFDPAAGTWGAWEIAARYSVLDLNDRAGLAGHATPTNGVRGGLEKISTLGLNWYPNQTLRLLLDYQNSQINRLGPTGAQIGENFQTYSIRTQVAF